MIDAGEPADEDAVLMRATFQLPEPYSVLSPVHIPRGFTKAYIAGEVVEDLPAKIGRAHASFAGYDVLLIEGTGHAIIVSEGGVGRPIDEIVLNASLFAKHGVAVAGAIVNKVDIKAQPGIEKVLRGGLAPYGIPLLGILPVRPILSNPTLEMILEGVHGETLNPGPDLERVIDGVAIGAMEPGHMLERVGPKTLVIVPGDREDVILTLTTAHLMGAPRPATTEELTRPDQPTLGLGDGHAGAAIGLVLTGGYRPRKAVIESIRRANLFATLVPDDTYTVASEVHDLLVKTHAADLEKIELIKELVASNLDVDRILGVATEADFAAR